MSKRNLSKDRLDGTDSALSVNTLQQFAATKKRCLSFHTTDQDAKISSVLERTKPHLKECIEKVPVETETFWNRFYKLECQLNAHLLNIMLPTSITHVYNPVEYASNLHCAYLQKFLKGPKRVVFVGMNPGPNGMGQTGVPFGNIKTVRNEMGLSGSVQQPASVHVKRPILGLECPVEEPSGARLWSLFIKLAGGSLDTFAEKCFVHNFCPLICYDKAGRNITPNELKGDYKASVGKMCLDILDLELELLQPEILVPIGEYMNVMVKRSRHVNSLKIYKLHHPSPRSLNNQNWPDKAEKLLQEFDLVKYIRNEI